MKDFIGTTLIIGLFSCVFTGCQDSSVDTIQQPTASQMKTSPSSPATKPKIILSHPKSAAESLGITVDDGKIIIDTKQTKEFLEGIGKKMKSSIKKIESSLRKEQISSPDETGIIITDTKMQIDLNKTKNFMEKWVRSMESVVNEINRTMGEIERALPKK